MGDVIEQAERKVAVKPPTRWRNWFHATESGPRYRAGLIAAHLTHPSKDVAESRAAEEYSRPCWRNEFERWGYTYLGAYPEGERPNV